MADHKIVYLIVDRGDPELPAMWRIAGYAYGCRDGSLNLKLDIHPGLKFNIRDPKSNGEREDAGAPPRSNGGNGNGHGNGGGNGNDQPPTTAQSKKVNDDDIPF